MSENFCPGCGAGLPVESINIAEGVALCPDCGRLSRLRDVVDRKRPINEVLADPPRGCSLTQQGHEIVATVRRGSLDAFIVTLGIALFWNGITSVFVLIAIAGLYSNLIGPLPEGFPAPPMDDAMGLGMSIFLCLFLIPFVAIGLGMFAATLLALAGKTEVVIGEHEANVATGVLFVKWRKRFDPQQVREVELVVPKLRNSEGDVTARNIAIRADRDVQFGSSIPEERRDWLYAVLRELLLNPDPQRQRELVLMTSGGWTHLGDA